MSRRTPSLLHPAMSSGPAGGSKSEQLPVSQDQIAVESPADRDLSSDSSSSCNIDISAASSIIDDVEMEFLDSEMLSGCNILDYLPSSLILEVLRYVSQFDLVNLLLVSPRFYALATDRLYRKVTVVLNAEFPIKSKGSRYQFIRDNAMKYMDTALILSYKNLAHFMNTVENNNRLLNLVRYFVFDKCHADVLYSKEEIESLQSHIINYFGQNSTSLNFLHITFLDYSVGDALLTTFLSNTNIRKKLFKFYVEDLNEIERPFIPPSLTNLFLRLNDFSLSRIPSIDLSTRPFDVFNSLATLCCATNQQLGLHILDKMQLVSEHSKLKLRNLTIIHRHKENLAELDRSELIQNLGSANPSMLQVTLEDKKFLDQISKRLEFLSIDSKIDVHSLSLLYLKVDCYEHTTHDCNCFPNFLNSITDYSVKHGGLPNLKTFDLELFPNLEWLRPHQILETILTPLGAFLRSLNGLVTLTIDFSTPGFKMFDNSMAMSSSILNKLNERLMEAFFLCFFSSENNKTILNLKTLQLPDFLTSFIYYKPDFYESLLHTCMCRGCGILLYKLEQMFYPLSDEDLDDDQDHNANLQSTYYILIGFILGKLQADREVCVPIKQRRLDFGHYPVYKGQPHTLHHQFHRQGRCGCQVEEDPDGLDEMNIDNLVTTYVVHQLQPMVEYLLLIFFKLDTLMIHGIHYERSPGEKRLVPVFDHEEYPPALLDGSSGVNGGVSYGRFGKKLNRFYR